ncbi:MAG: hypothetical protein AAGA60_04665 [Cyanobacteria bacterium P01_E01_bin.42]
MKLKSSLPLVFEGDVGGTIGFAKFSEADSDILEESCTCSCTDEPPSSIAKFAAEVMEDSLLMQQVGDRVYELMIEDFAHQSERYRNYRRGLSR